MAPSSKPVFVLVQGATNTPSQYAYLQHLLLSQGYGALSALLPTVGATSPVTAEDDAEYIRSRMLLPLLDMEGRDVIMISHSYGGMPASAAARGLGKADRAAEGKTTSVLGQICIATILPRGGDGKDVFATFGGQLPPHIQVDEKANLIGCADPIPPVYHDVPPILADGAILSGISHGLTAFKSPCPVASWDAEAYKGRCAYIRTLNDRALPLDAQNMMLEATGQDWVIRDIETGHCPQLAAPEKLCGIIVELAEHFGAM